MQSILTLNQNSEILRHANRGLLFLRKLHVDAVHEGFAIIESLFQSNENTKLQRNTAFLSHNSLIN